MDDEFSTWFRPLIEDELEFQELMKKKYEDTIETTVDRLRFKFERKMKISFEDSSSTRKDGMRMKWEGLPEKEEKGFIHNDIRLSLYGIMSAEIRPSALRLNSKTLAAMFNKPADRIVKLIQHQIDGAENQGAIVSVQFSIKMLSASLSNRCLEMYSGRRVRSEPIHHQLSPKQAMGVKSLFPNAKFSVCQDSLSCVVSLNG